LANTLIGIIASIKAIIKNFIIVYLPQNSHVS
jgi:hypothetical protein